MRNIDGLFRVINRISAEADWQSDELRNEIRASGVDPDRLLNRVSGRLAELMGRTKTKSETKGFTLPLLNELKRHSGLSAPEIARKLEVPLAFLSAVERNVHVIPFGWRVELATRAERTLQISRDAVVAALGSPLQFELAAFSDRLSDENTSYEQILEESGMNDSTKQFWLAIAST
jgi:hypothetical protein